jgi:outer membrane protease
MKKIAVFFIFVSTGISFSPFLLYADPGRDSRPESAYTLSLGSQFGMFWGAGEEQVYKNGESDQLLSQLLWDIKPLWYTGMSMDFSRRDPSEKIGVFGALSVKFGVPAISGVMEDRDWLASGDGLSHYSRHTGVTDGAVILDLAAGLSVPAWNFMTIRFFLGFSYTRFSWTAHDGYYRYGRNKGGGQYEPLTDSDSTVLVSGAVVSYSQDWLFLPFGIRVSIFPDRLFSGDLYYRMGPMVKFLGLDNHYMRNSWKVYGQFADETNTGYALEPGGEFRFSPLKNFSLALRLSWRSITASPHGASFGRYSGEGSWDWNFLGNTAGGALQILDLGIGLEVRL